MISIAPLDTLVPLRACLALKDNLLRTLQWGAERIRQGGRGATTLYCKQPSSLEGLCSSFILLAIKRDRRAGGW